MEFSAIITLVSILLLFIILFFSVYLIMLNRRLKYQIEDVNEYIKVQNMKKTELVVDETFKPLYIQQTYGFKLEDYFISDIYKDMSEDLQPVKAQEDYFKIFTTAIDTILRQRDSFQQNFRVLSTPDCLQYDYCIPLVKCAKFSVDYDKYLSRSDQSNFTILVEKQYPDFEVDDRYYILLDNGKCKKHVHLLFFIQKTIELYTNHPQDVNECLYYNKCKTPALRKKLEKYKYTDTCTL